MLISKLKFKVLFRKSARATLSRTLCVFNGERSARQRFGVRLPSTALEMVADREEGHLTEGEETKLTEGVLMRRRQDGSFNLLCCFNSSPLQPILP
jgi:hypothetical protein